jgi:hypothetical protein
MRAISFGYGRATARDLALVAADDCLVVDVRLRPFSRKPGFSRDELRARFGDRYVWLKEAGNAALDTGGVRFVDEDLATCILAALLKLAPCIILCGCSDARACHRTVLLEKVADLVPDLAVEDGSAPVDSELKLF